MLICLGEQYSLIIADRDVHEAGSALKGVFNGKIDHMECSSLSYPTNFNSDTQFDQHYFTGSARRAGYKATREQDHNTETSPQDNSKPGVVVKDRGRQLSNRLDFLHKSPEFSQKRGVLERHTPQRKYDITTRSRRQSDVLKQEEEIIIRPTLRRETRSQRALIKNLPYSFPLLRCVS